MTLFNICYSQLTVIDIKFNTLGWLCSSDCLCAQVVTVFYDQVFSWLRDKIFNIHSVCLCAWTRDGLVHIVNEITYSGQREHFSIQFTV